VSSGVTSAIDCWWWPVRRRHQLRWLDDRLASSRPGLVPDVGSARTAAFGHADDDRLQCKARNPAL